MPLLPTDMDFKAAAFAYVASEGADALFRLTVARGAITAVGSTARPWQLRRPARRRERRRIRLPIGVAISKT